MTDTVTELQEYLQERIPDHDIEVQSGFNDELVPRLLVFVDGVNSTIQYLPEMAQDLVSLHGEDARGLYFNAVKIQVEVYINTRDQ